MIIDELFVKLTEESDRWEAIAIMDEITHQMTRCLKNKSMTFSEANYIDTAMRAVYAAR